MTSLSIEMAGEVTMFEIVHLPHVSKNIACVIGCAPAWCDSNFAEILGIGIDSSENNYRRCREAKTTNNNVSY
jgi:hypothetical protein